jgi:hypothetical protein
MFGRHRHREATENTVTAVDVHLEWDVDAVQEAVITFLRDASDGGRQSLARALETLDNQINLSDAYAESILDASIFGQAPKGAVLGETSSHSMAEEVPGDVLRAQIALVRAAKAVVRDPTPSAIDELRTVSTSLATAIGKPDAR